MCTKHGQLCTVDFNTSFSLSGLNRYSAPGIIIEKTSGPTFKFSSPGAFAIKTLRDFEVS